MNFKSADSVESALSLAGSDCGGRTIRVQRCVKKAKVAVTDKQGQRKVMTKKRFQDRDKNAFQGKRTGDKDEKGKKVWTKKRKPVNKGERQKRQISAKLQGGGSGAKKRKLDS